jgi:streptomycin 6-kinase
MNDIEIENLLDEAGYRYELAAGQFIAVDPQDLTDYSAQDVAEELEIPIDDLTRWEQRVRHEDEIAGA